MRFGNHNHINNSLNNPRNGNVRIDNLKIQKEQQQNTNKKTKSKKNLRASEMEEEKERKKTIYCQNVAKHFYQ